MSAQRVIVTGATGFVGSRLAALLGPGARTIALHASGWADAIRSMDFRDATVFHLAARVPGALSRQAQFEHDNVEKTRALARHAAAGGARRFVFLSTIHVNGAQTRARPFRFDDPAAPASAYARSKHAAEQTLATAAAGSGLEWVIVRAPLVYGAGARGTLRALARLADSALPLPFAALDNRRSFIHVDDLARALVATAAAPRAAGATLLVSHRESISTARLVASMRAQLARAPRLFRVDTLVLETAAALVGAGDRMRSLTRSLEVDPAHAESVLGWRAQLDADSAIADVVSAGRER